MIAQFYTEQKTASEAVAHYYANKQSTTSEVYDTDTQFAIGQFYAESDPDGLIGSAAYNPELYCVPSPRGKRSTDAWDTPSVTSSATHRGREAEAEWDGLVAVGNGPPAAVDSGSDGHVDSTEVAVEVEASNEPEQFPDGLDQLLLASRTITPPAEPTPAFQLPTWLSPADIDSTAPASLRRRRMSDPGDVRPSTVVSQRSSGSDELDLGLSFTFSSDRSPVAANGNRSLWSFYKFRFHIT